MDWYWWVLIIYLGLGALLAVPFVITGLAFQGIEQNSRKAGIGERVAKGLAVVFFGTLLVAVAWPIIVLPLGLIWLRARAAAANLQLDDEESGQPRVIDAEVVSSKPVEEPPAGA